MNTINSDFGIDFKLISLSFVRFVLLILKQVEMFSSDKLQQKQTIDNSHTIRHVGNISSPSKTLTLASMQDGAFCA